MNSNYDTLIASIGLTLTAAVAAAELRVYPPEASLAGVRDRQAVVVQRVLPTGETRDVTDECDARVADESIAAFEHGVLRPSADGATTLRVAHDGHSAEVPVAVQRSDADAPLSFGRDVMPVFMKAGCNMGKCHGSARGQDGFRLSLFGFDPPGDHFRLVGEMPGRRVNVARPEASLLLTKAIGESPHTGGKRFDRDSESYATLLRWIEEGAGDDAEESAADAEPIGITVYPPEAVLVGPTQRQRLVVVARYADGATRDVTPLAVYLSNNDSAAAVDEAGVVTSGARGEAFVMARYATFTEGVPVIVLPEGGGPEFTEPEAFNEVDRVVYDKLRKLRITPSAVCSDEVFLRRVSLDLTGLTPTPERFEAFLSDESPDKRARLVGELLRSQAFVDVWTMRLGELLRIRSENQVSYKALLRFHNWVRDRVAAGEPLDRLFGEVLAASGGTFDTPSTNFFQIEANSLQLTENVAQSYLGMRIQCAQCHNHPFDRWTMDDYYGFASFFSQVGFKQSRDPREFIVYDAGRGEIDHVVTGEPVAPTYLGGGPADCEDRDRREALAEWIVSPQNKAFARNLANIVWAHHFGRGIVEPVDDVRISNPPSNEELLDYLAGRLVESGYDLRSLVREIVTSRTYQLATAANPTNRHDAKHFSRAQVRRLRAEALLDSISQITATTDDFPRLPAGARAAQIADGATSNYFLSTFGRAPRETVCACEVDVQPNLSQALHLLNGDATNDKVTEGGVVPRLLGGGATPRQVVERLYVACYSRRPTEVELERLLATIDSADPAQSLNDVFWALLNSKEFLFNH
ncbi:DUF1549 and DUF1553 domain-containing protein [Botrimarina sp.]|uniref:DUF1549 and DUF1553 domain-containing protein n=1 Tax=Botrimarina sp. TaxID=2795802 RepID=UPI0032ED6C0E